jgi:hypothetical protein
MARFVHRCCRFDRNISSTSIRTCKTSRWLQIRLTHSTAPAQVPGPAQDKATKIALDWGIFGNPGGSGVATSKVRTRVKILADEEKRDAIVNAFEVSYVFTQGPR